MQDIHCLTQEELELLKEMRETEVAPVEWFRKSGRMQPVEVVGYELSMNIGVLYTSQVVFLWISIKSMNQSL